MSMQCNEKSPILNLGATRLQFTCVLPKDHDGDHKQEYRWVSRADWGQYDAEVKVVQ